MMLEPPTKNTTRPVRIKVRSSQHSLFCLINIPIGILYELEKYPSLLINYLLKTRTSCHPRKSVYIEKLLILLFGDNESAINTAGNRAQH